MTEEVKGFRTRTGCTISLTPFGFDPLAGPDAKRLSLDMEQDGDGRHAEVLLGHQDIVDLRTLLGPDERALERARHDMPAELYNELVSLLISKGTSDTRCLKMADWLRTRYGAATRRRLGLD